VKEKEVGCRNGALMGKKWLQQKAVRMTQAAHRVRAVDGKVWHSNTCTRNEELLLKKRWVVNWMM
jgi:hypothetical protein